MKAENSKKEVGIRFRVLLKCVGKKNGFAFDEFTKKLLSAT